MEAGFTRSMKWTITSVILTISIIIVSLTACKSPELIKRETESKETHILNTSTSSDNATNSGNVTASKNGIMQAKDIKSNTSLWISNDDYQNAIKRFDMEFFNDSRVIETFREKNPCMNQLFLDDGHKNYIIAWNNFGFSSILIVFIKENSNFVPIYCDRIVRDITAVKQVDLGLDEKFIEITSYYGTGSHKGQKAKILAIKDKVVTNAWEYETISYDAGPNNTYEKSYASFTFFPMVFESPRINLQQIVISEKSKKETETTFLWNEQQNKFVEK